jgi:hypothetical protein
MKAIELDWFDFETRMRELLRTQLESVVTQASRDREQTSTMKKQLDSQHTRIEELESAVLWNKTRATVFEDIYQRLAENEGNRQKDFVKMTQEVGEMGKQQKAVEFKVQKHQEAIGNLEAILQRQSTDLSTFNDKLAQHKSTISNELSQVNSEFKQANEIYLDFVRRTEEKATQAFQKSISTLASLAKQETATETVKKELVQLQAELRNLKQTKVETESHEEDMSSLRSVLDAHKKYHAVVADQFEIRDNFLDRFYPYRFLTVLSDTLHAVWDKPMRRKLAELENGYLKDLNLDALATGAKVDSREVAVQKILEEVKRVEQRKMSLIAEKKHKRNATNSSAAVESQPSSDTPQYSRLASTDMSPAKPRPGQAAPAREEDDGELEGLLLAKFQAEAMRLTQETRKQYERMKSDLSSNQEELRVYIQQVLGEVEVADRKRQQLKEEIIVDLGDIVQRLSESESKGQETSTAVTNLADIVACLVEDVQIAQEMEAQEEEDRHIQAVNIEQPTDNPRPPAGNKSVTPSGVLAMQKKCLSCQGTTHTALAGVKTAVMYQSTPLKYRDKQYTRAELIAVRRRMVRGMWAQVCSLTPWKRPNEPIDSGPSSRPPNPVAGSAIQSRPSSEGKELESAESMQSPSPVYVYGRSSQKHRRLKQAS